MKGINKKLNRKKLGNKFLYKIQQQKMRELWDNEEDESLEKSIYLKK
jgi:hypothetical protein